MAVIPAKVLAVTITDIQNESLWSENDGAGSLTLNKAYRWTVTLDIPEALVHSSHETTRQFLYDGRDIEVGDYIATSNDGKFLKIISITSQTNQSCVCIAEDEDRLNTFQDTTGQANGAIPKQEGFLFEVKNGYPILYPLPPDLLSVFPNIGAQILSRFLFRSKTGTLTIHQAGHTFSVGDSVYLASNGTYGKIDITSTGQNFIGTVIGTGVPGASSFTLKTVGPIIQDTVMPNNADVGGYVYLDPATPGGLTGVAPTLYGNSNAVFIKLSSTSGVLISSSVGSATGSGSTVYVVTDLTERNNINNPATGSLAYVTGTGGEQASDEWTLYIYLGSTWSELTNQDAGLVDAGTGEVIIDKDSNSMTSIIKSVSTKSRVFSVSVNVTQAFDTASTIKIGDSNDDDRYMTIDENDLSVVGNYVSYPTFKYNTTTENDIDLVYTKVGTPTTGSATIQISYV